MHHAGVGTICLFAGNCRDTDIKSLGIATFKGRNVIFIGSKLTRRDCTGLVTEVGIAVGPQACISLKTSAVTISQLMRA